MSDLLDPGLPFPVQLEMCTWDENDYNAPSDYHLHTAYTDGTASVLEMAKAAVSNGMARILFSEHVRHTSKYFGSFMLEVRKLQYSGLKAYVGIETKILDFNGSLDCSPQLASECDAIIGSVHSLPVNEKGHVVSWSQLDVERGLEAEFQLALAIVKKSRAHILGHPLGMVIKQFNIQPIDLLYELACACRDSNKAFELNARYCPDPQAWIDIVQKADCKVSFGSDAHETSDVGSSWRKFMHNRIG